MPSFIILLISIVLFFGCATAPVEKQTLIWPEQPNEPRYVYLDSYYGELGLVEYGFWDRFFGVTSLPLPLLNPTSVFAINDRIYVSVPGSKHVAVIDTVKKQVTYLGTSGKGRLKRPLGVSGMPDGSLIFVSDIALKRVMGYGPNGELKVRIGDNNELKNPVGMAVNSSLNRLYVVDSRDHKVNVYSTTGSFLFSFGKPGQGDGQFLFPTSAAVEQGTGNVYVVDTQNFRVQVFDKDGKFLSKFGKLGDSVGTFSRPKGVAIDSEGHVYVMDAAFDSFQVFNENRDVLLVVGTAGIDRGQFNLPEGIYIDDKDRVYVADTLNGRVQVFQYLSEKWKKEHPEEYKKYLLMPDAGKTIKEPEKQ